MADAIPNYKVEQQRLKMRIAEQHSNIERQTLDIMEMADRKLRHEENIEAAHRAIAQYQSDLSALENAHGKLDENEIEAMSASIERI